MAASTVRRCSAGGAWSRHDATARLATRQTAVMEANAGERQPFDPVAESVAAYTPRVDEFESSHATKMLEATARFSASLPVPSRILDAGCGPGRDLARFVAYGHDPRGVDLNPAFVAKANAFAPTIQCDLRELSARFPDGAFDGIWACASLVHLLEPDAIDVLGQFARLVRPAGKLFAAVKMTGETGWTETAGRRWFTVWDAERLRRRDRLRRVHRRAGRPGRVRHGVGDGTLSRAGLRTADCGDGNESGRRCARAPGTSRSDGCRGTRPVFSRPTS